MKITNCGILLPFSSDSISTLIWEHGMVWAGLPQTSQFACDMTSISLSQTQQLTNQSTVLHHENNIWPIREQRGEQHLCKIKDYHHDISQSQGGHLVHSSLGQRFVQFITHLTKSTLILEKNYILQYSASPVDVKTDVVYTSSTILTVFTQHKNSHQYQSICYNWERGSFWGQGESQSMKWVY